MRRSPKGVGLALATLVATVALTPWGTPAATADDTTSTGAWRLQQPAMAGEAQPH